jgi:phage-related protein
MKSVRGWFRIQPAEMKCSKPVKGCSIRRTIINEDIGKFLTARRNCEIRKKN